MSGPASPGFESILKWRDENTVEEISVTYHPPDPVVVQLRDGTEISVAFSWSWSGMQVVTTEAHVEQRAKLVVSFPSPTELPDAIAIGGKLRNFLNLGVGHPVHPLEIVGILNPAAAGHPAPATKVEPRVMAIEVFYRMSDDPAPADLDRKVYPHEMPFSLDDVRETLGDRLTSWIERYELLKPTFDLYFGVVYGAMRYLEPRFLTLAQALETYHRRATTNVAPTPAAEQPTPRRRRREPTLRERLADILQRCPDVTTKLVSDPELFLDQVVKGRNYYTHYDESLHGRAPQEIKLLPLTAQLRAFIEMCLLIEIGFTSAEIDGIFERSDRYRDIEHLREVAFQEGV